MLIVGIGEYLISNDAEECIVTHALGSCIALTVHCPKSGHTALAHIVLPKSNNSSQSGFLKEKPGYFADQIVPKVMEFFLIEKRCRPSELQVYMAGGADSLNENDIFKVGKRNTEMVKNLLKGFQIMPYKMDTGGNISRTVYVDVVSGNVRIVSQNMIL